MSSYVTAEQLEQIGTIIGKRIKSHSLKKHAETVGDGQNTSFTITHGFGTRDLIVQTFGNADPWVNVIADVYLTSADEVRIEFANAPAQDAYRVVILA